MTLVKIQDIKIGNRFRKDLGDVSPLVKSIQRHGLLHPVVLTEKNELIYGRRRLEAYKQLGKMEIEAHYFNNSYLALPEAEADENIVRKSFTIEEIAEIDTFYREKEEAAARERQRSGKPLGNFPESRSREKIAKRIGVSDRTLEKIRLLKEAATKDPETYGSFWNKANSQRLSIEKAYRKVKQRLKIQEAEKAASDNNATTATTNSSYDLKLGDMSEKCREIEDNSIDLIFTDPPYNQENIPIYGELAKVAQRVLKPGGSLITFVGHHALFKIGNQVEDNSELQYHWQLVVKHNGRITKMWKQRIWPKYKPLSWYYKPNNGNGAGPTVFKDMSDLIESQEAEKTMHEWEQSPVEAKHVIESLTVKNQIVLDPFMGYATTGVGALELKRKFIWIEIDQSRYSDAINRLAQFAPS